MYVKIYARNTMHILQEHDIIHSYYTFKWLPIQGVMSVVKEQTGIKRNLKT